MQFTGYVDLKKLDEGASRIIYSGVRGRDQKEVIIKALRSEHPTTDSIALMYHDFEVSKELDFPGIIQTYDLIDQQNKYALVQENMHGLSLHKYLKENPITDLSVFFKIAIQMATILDWLHQNHIIHKDIKPSNFIIHPATLHIKLTDFNFSSRLLHEMQEIVPPNKLEGTLAYMAPEQTGRMNMNIDYRSDFYSLGVTFYEMLAGHLPFSYIDPLELLHAHLAASIPELPNVPYVIFAIIRKLMAKNPIERYQSAIGLRSDLERCLKEFTESGSINNFTLGSNDVFDHLNLSQKLYGREPEAAELLAVYEEVSQGAVKALMVCGYSGIGKTMLVNEVHKPMVKHKGYFVSGKFDLLQRNTPYTAITQAFNQLARLILAEPESTFTAIKHEIEQALGGVAQVMIDLAPDLELILGPQPPLEKLAPQETQNRMIIFFKRFLKAVANQNHPLVLFIDDLQWIDTGSLKLFESLLTDNELTHVLLLGAYRDNEVDKEHVLQYFFDSITVAKGNIHFLKLAPLTVQHYEDFLMDSFNRPREVIHQFAELIHKRTEGNPFFCKQIINTLYRERIPYFNYDQREWEWNIDKVLSLDIADNVVDLMLSKVTSLPKETQELLKFASCIGNRFTIDMLMLISAKSAEEVGKALWPALQQELVVTLRLGYKRVDAFGQENLAAILSKDITYQFIHDRVQQAVSEGISAAEKQKIHFQIAKLLLENEADACKKERLFELVDHFNAAHDLIEEADKALVVRLNLEAGIQAGNSNAYQPMANYLESALQLMTPDWWNSNYELTFRVYRQYVLSLFLLKRIDESFALTEQLLLQAKTPLDKVAVYRLQIMGYQVIGRTTELFEVARTALGLLNVTLKIKPSKIDLSLKLLQIKWLMRGHKVENLDDDLPEVQDPSIIGAFEVLLEIFAPAHYTSVELYVYIGLICVQLQLQYGRPPSAGFLFAVHAGNLLNISRSVDQTFSWWTLAKKLLEQSQNKYSLGYGYFIYAYFINCFRCHPKVAEEFYLDGMRYSNESGNNLVDVSCRACLAHNEVIVAKSIEKVIERKKLAHKGYVDLQYKDAAEASALWCIVHENLFKGEHTRVDEIKQLEEKLKKSENFYFTTLAYRELSYYYYFLEDFQQAVFYKHLYYAYEPKIRYVTATSEIKLLNALALIKCIATSSGTNRRSYKKEFSEILEYMKWLSDECPGNYLHSYLYLKAEEAHLQNKFDLALKLLNEGISNAKKGDFYLWVALGNELAVDVLKDQGQPRSVTDYVREAHYYYNRYGMTVKVRALEQKYPHCFVAAEGLTTTSSNLDFMSVIKAGHIISEEIIIEKLFEKMLHIVIENLGAQKALFLECRAGSWKVVAQTDVIEGEEHFTLLDPENEDGSFPKTIIDYALRAKQPVVLANAAEDAHYRLDPYIQHNLPKSVFCLPIEQHEKVVGIMYMENNLTTAVFTRERVTVLSTLAAQIAISLQNARLIEHMERLYKSTERFVPKSFLKLLSKEHVEDVQLGDSTAIELTVLFNDIRDYTTITEKQTPAEAFAFINAYFKVMAPIIRTHNGFINQYQGDAIMALFPRSPDDAVKAVEDLEYALAEFNQQQQRIGKQSLQVGYGLNTGLAMLGTIGEEERMDANVISDAINLASRIEGLNKIYGTQFLISEATKEALSGNYQTRLIDKVRVKGKNKAIYLYEVSFDEGERNFIQLYEKGFKDYETGSFLQALEHFNKCLEIKPQDIATQLFIKRCNHLIVSPPGEMWDGTYVMTQK